MDEFGNKFVSEELEEQGFLVEPGKYDISDEGESAERTTDIIAGKEIIEKGFKAPHLNSEQAKVLKERFFGEKSRAKIGKEMKSKPGVALRPQKIAQIEEAAISRLRKFLIKSQEQESENWQHLNLAKQLTSHLYPNNKNRFLIVAYLSEYFQNRYNDFSQEEQVALFRIARNDNRDHIIKFLGLDFPSYNEAGLNNLLNTVLNKIRQIVEKKFPNP